MRHRISKLAAVSLVGAGLALGSFAGVAAAQDMPNAPERHDARGGHDWGWIGLFGLIGLAGLMGREKRTTYPSPHTTATGRV